MDYQVTNSCIPLSWFWFAGSGSSEYDSHCLATCLTTSLFVSRLHFPVFGGSGRVLSKDITFSGYNIPQGVSVLYCNMQCNNSFLVCCTLRSYILTAQWLYHLLACSPLILSLSLSFRRLSLHHTLTPLSLCHSLSLSYSPSLLSLLLPPSLSLSPSISPSHACFKVIINSKIFISKSISLQIFHHSGHPLP